MASLVFCSSCNRQVDAAAAACPHCGRKRTPGAAGSSSGSTTAIIIVVCVIGVVFVLGILAAIAIPAYQDYVVRAKVAETLLAASEAKSAVASYVADKHELPTSLDEVEIDANLRRATLDIDEDSGALVITMQEPPVADQSFALQPVLNDARDAVLDWQCYAIDIRERYLPMQCRQNRGQ